MRPKEVKDICVEAYLETAHIGEIPTYGDKFKTDTDTTQTLSLYKEATRPNLKASGSITYSVRPGWEIDISNNGGYKINILKEEGKQFCGVTEIDQKHLVLKGEVATAIKEEWDPGIEKDDDGKTKGPVNKPTKTKEPIDGVLEANATVYLRQGERTQTGSASGLYITGRGCCCCQTVDDRNKRLLSESVVWEQFMPLALTTTVGDFARMSVVDANRVRAEIDRMMVKSMNHPDRYEAGTINFAETQLVAQSVGSIISTGGHPDDHMLGEIRGLGEIVGKKIALRSPNILRILSTDKI